jgi:hypothetical protein
MVVENICISVFLGGTMAIAIEKRFEALVSDVQVIQKELILSKMQHIKKTRRSQDVWDALSQRVSTTWDSVSTVDEIALQREKQW